MDRNKKYNLEERALAFSKHLIEVCKQVKLSFVNKGIIDQLLRAGTNVGANYHEANGAVSKKDFRSKIGICKKEAKEIEYWLRLLLSEQGENDFVTSVIKSLIEESHEFVLIFSRILQSSQSSQFLPRKGII